MFSPALTGALFRTTVRDLADCHQVHLNLEIPPHKIRQESLDHLVRLLNSTTFESDDMRIGAICLLWSANADIYERLDLAMRRKWQPMEVIEGAPTASHWLGLKLQTAMDKKEIQGNKESKRTVTHNTRICIDAGEPCTITRCISVGMGSAIVLHNQFTVDWGYVWSFACAYCAVRLMGRYMSQKRQDRPEAQIVGPASVLLTGLNISLDEDKMLSQLIAKFAVAKCSQEKSSAKANLWPLSQSIFMALLWWYREAIECQVKVLQNARYVLPYLATPTTEQMDAFLDFVGLYNKTLNTINPSASNDKTTLSMAARMCDQITLSTGQGPTASFCMLRCPLPLN